MKYRFVKRALILCAALVTLNPVLGDEFKNSVVNLKLNKDNSGCIQVKVITSKPYPEKIFVNEKPNNTYVILLPETQNSINVKPVLDSVSDSVNGISIKTQPYVAGGCKGYTKIIITATKPIKISATAAQNSTNSTIVIKKDIKPTIQSSVQQTVKPKVETKPVVQPKPQQVVKPKVETKPVVQPKPQQTVKPKVETKPVVQPKPQQTVKPKVETKPVVQPKPQQTVKPKVETKPVVQPKPQQTVKPKVETKPVVQPKPQQTVKPKSNFNINLKQNTIYKYSKELISKIHSRVTALSELINIKNNLVKSLLILSAIGFPIIVIFFIILMNRRIKEQIAKINQYNEQENPNIEEIEQSESDINNFEMEQGNENNVLEESNNIGFAEMLENAPVNDDTIEENPLNQNIDEFINSKEETPTEESEEEQELVEETPTEESEEEQELVEETPIEESEEEQELVEETPTEESEEEQELVEETSTEESEEEQELVEEIPTEESEEEQELVEEIPTEESEEEQELVEETPTEESEEEQELVEGTPTEESEEEQELVEETPTEESEEGQELVEGTPTEESEEEQELVEETPTEESEEGQELVEGTPTEESEEEQELVEEIPTEESEEELFDLEYEPDGFINEYEDNDDDSIFDELRNNTLTIEDEAEPIENSTEDDSVFDELRGEYETTVDGLTVLAHTAVNSVSGFYLVNFENFSSLIGYIKDEIFVLKTFDEFVNNNIYIKPAEQLSESTYRYIVRIGLYKMVIEVSDKKMSHLIDL